ncbi:hypothetical protein [Gluconobacter kanchanaburiensis]|uniref:Uncharacterized protein n=1 Tax=Gluconobacter kanchanaburiensis NBRC 103587 TaxID=1307948 RepID=A0A511BH07_9PROT|nr:hypothetical protein [Gluconobacter kanchanaburiensis]GBR69081.1 hypothetical protein AA103587_1130 [Gluconobacter kanchanaburiensis NBRC 103587]GEK97087.1 hypothetical protein GKA01_22840 [Gluconobacter kanchanaburiensis NBRC 103587]
MAFLLRLNLPPILSGLMGACLLFGLLMRVLPASLLRRLGLILLLPGPGLALALASTHYGPRWLEGVLIAPAVIFPTAATLLTLPPGTTRAAIGLGANLQMRLRLIWLPLLMPSLFLSLALATVFSVACALVDHL